MNADDALLVTLPSHVDNSIIDAALSTDVRQQTITDCEKQR